jgi:hypothetical protein
MSPKDDPRDIGIQDEGAKPTVIPESALVEQLAAEIFEYFDPPRVSGVFFPEVEARSLAWSAVQRALAAGRPSSSKSQ